MPQLGRMLRGRAGDAGNDLKSCFPSPFPSESFRLHWVDPGQDALSLHFRRVIPSHLCEPPLVLLQAANTDCLWASAA